MREDLDKQLVASYPKLYRNRDKTPQESCMSFGFDVGDGWFDLLNELSAKISAIIDSMPEEEQEYHCASQVKQKFSGLRFYMEGHDEQIQKLIDEAEGKSFQICEGCGEPADMDSKSPPGTWMSVLCPACRIKEKLRYKK